MKDKLRYIFRNVNSSIVIVLVILIASRIVNSGQSVGEWIMSELMLLPGIIIGLTFHEAAHGYVSYWLGDPTPKIQGRLTLNPLKHIEPVGFVALLIAGFGWGNPVQINPMYYKNRRRDEILVNLAGVTMNLIIAIIAALMIRFSLDHMSVEFYYNGIGGIIVEILLYVFMINIVLMVFNLLRVPPLDGFGLVTQIFNLRKYDWYWTIKDKGFIILMLLIICNVTDIIINPVYNFFFNLLIV